jgi:hypothetical protein
MARVMETALDVMDCPWEWGRADCCTSACDVFLRLYGIDPMASLRGTYSTQRGAAKAIARMGGFDQMAATLAARAGMQPVEPRVGAVGVTHEGLVICARPGVWLGKTLTGMTTVREVSAAYHVET